MTDWQDFLDNPGPRRVPQLRPVCDHDRQLGVLITRRGHPRAISYCMRCGHSIAVAHDSLQESLWTLPVFIDNSAKCCGGDGCSQCADRCAKCGTYSNTERHHWAPYHLFGDEANEWPQATLCRECHTLWHRIVTPNMGKRTT